MKLGTGQLEIPVPASATGDGGNLIPAAVERRHNCGAYPGHRNRDWRLRLNAAAFPAEVTPRWVFKVEGERQGSVAVMLATGDALFLARSFTGVPLESAAELSGDDREALDELWRQVMGQFAALLLPDTWK